MDFYDRLPYFETSAATGQNVAKVVECLLDMVMLRMEQCVDKTQRPFAQNGKRLHNGEMDEYDGSSKCACWVGGRIFLKNWISSFLFYTEWYKFIVKDFFLLWIWWKVILSLLSGVDIP